MRSDSVSSCRHLFHDFWMPASMLADREEHGFGALVGQRLEYSRRMTRPRTVVESQHNFVVAQEVISLEMLKTESGTTRCVDLDHTGNTKRVRIVAFCRCGRRCWCCRRRRCRCGGCSWRKRLRILGPGGRTRR